MVQRQVPKPAEILELMQFKKPELNGRKRRLDAALTIYDLRAHRQAPHARRRRSTTPTARRRASCRCTRARQAFEDIEFHPAILRDVSTVDTSTADPRRPSGPAVRHRADRASPA